ncbi:MAG: hypothetical protein H7Z19_03350 [Chitinophagaceae bacterium]|nr:hypothetical protein [Rubrivivax sp.]
MFYALIWFVVFSLLALWSLAAWAFHSIAAWAVENAGVLAGSPVPAQALRVPDWFAPWIPPELTLAFTSALSALTPAIESLLEWVPALAGGLSVAVWVFWAIGCALLVILAVTLSGVVAMLRRRASVRTRPLIAA